MNDRAMLGSIKEVIESLPRDTPERREACLDALYANKVGGKALEQLFDYWLWSEGEPQQEAHLAYVIALGEIEEALVFNDLVYQDRRSSAD
nr:MAG TPA: hypothetical protein [Caudoviricetes sp.]